MYATRDQNSPEILKKNKNFLFLPVEVIVHPSLQLHLQFFGLLSYPSLDKSFDVSVLFAQEDHSHSAMYKHVERFQCSNPLNVALTIPTLYSEQQL